MSCQRRQDDAYLIFDSADRGLSKTTKEEHARDLPLMNGIKEVIKSVGVLASGSSDYQKALYNISSHLALSINGINSAAQPRRLGCIVWASSRRVHSKCFVVHFSLQCLHSLLLNPPSDPPPNLTS